MGLFDRVRKRGEAAGLEDQVLTESELLRALLSPDSIGIKEAMSVPTFAGCVNHICNAISIIPIRLYQREKDGSIEQVKDDIRTKLLNDDTGDTLTGPDFKRAMVYDYLTNKGGYAFIKKTGRRYVSLHYVDATQVTFLESQDPIFKDYQVMVSGKKYEAYQFVKFLRRTKNGYRGKSLIDENQTILSTAYNSIKFENAQVKKGGQKRGFLQSEQNLTEKAVTALKAAFQKLYRDDNENVIVLNNGVKFQESSETSVEMQLNENKKLNGTEICKLFNMPPAIIAGGATAADWSAYVQYCIVPILEVFCDALNRDLLAESEKKDRYFAPDVYELTKGDVKSRYEAYQIGYKTGFLQIDEIRKKENLPDMGIPFLKLGLQDVLYDPETGMIFMPNMNKWANVKNIKDEGTDLNVEDSEGGNPPTGDAGVVNQPPKVTEPTPGKEKSDEDNTQS